ncbi:DUF1508 domain-containing protein [Stutzerimonas degradans]|uniref:FRG domain-containing protein n=1 Tax=Stutzerimonas degradans TaxID=2968968 RepID=A0A8E2QFD7_9GAMM|nr:DUF1508 domain-containing protein [Stutzerimonas degradans]PNF76950.1 hypothetical protein CXK95_04465 [Stutzerimonas degradans]QPT21499.1 DUF1508 domain-containing protein [Stutzerimonas degradans]
MLGKFQITQSKNGTYHFSLLGTKGQVLLVSESYKHKESALNAISTVKNYVTQERAFHITEASNGGFYFTLKAANGQVIGQSQMYRSRESAYRGVAEVIRHASESGTQDLSKSTNIEKIGSVTTFLKLIGEIAIDPNFVLFYRGHDDANYNLAPSVFREPGWISNEHVMFHEVVLRCPEEFNSSRSMFNSLVKMQHYSLPTRLLDITSNPLVALYFACADTTSKDGEVIVFSVKKTDIKYCDSDAVSVVSNISRMPPEFSVNTKKNLKEFNDQYEVQSLVREIQREKPYFEARVRPEDMGAVLCVKPILDNPRIIKQGGAFFLFGMGKDKTRPAEIPSEYLISRDENRLLIASQYKKKILKQLEYLGISRSSIFPEIEHVASFIKESYKEI